MLGSHRVGIHDRGVKANGLELIFHGLQDGGVAVGHEYFLGVLIAVFFSHGVFLGGCGVCCRLIPQQTAFANQLGHALGNGLFPLRIAGADLFEGVS